MALSSAWSEGGVTLLMMDEPIQVTVSAMMTHQCSHTSTHPITNDNLRFLQELAHATGPRPRHTPQRAHLSCK